ncbi:hypothetical protein P2318_34595 [Myxococcaceae bacterium GXIMD 01537]
MLRPLARAVLVAGLALAALPGCRKKEEPASPPATSQDSGPLAPRAGVKVPLPSGWTALVAADGSFQAGPPGRPVMRVDIRPGEAEKLPTKDAIVSQVAREMPGYAVSIDQEEETGTETLMRFTLAPKLADGGVGAHGPVLYGARRVGDDLFLCATLPGASYEDVRLATEACRTIEVQSAPR